MPLSIQALKAAGVDTSAIDAKLSIIKSVCAREIL